MVELTGDPVGRIRGALAGRRVLVTGHTGFKGGWLSAWLSEIGAVVAGVSLAPDPNQQPLFELVRESVPFAESHYHDIRDVDFLGSLVKRFEPDLVVHLAAQPLVRRSYQEPLQTFDVNVRGTAALLEAVRAGGTQAVICVTSDKCYENTGQTRPYREADPFGGWDPYSASKGAAELLVQSYQRSFFGSEGVTACASARAGNVVGGGDLAADRVVPDLYRAMADATPLILRQPRAIRPWQHVLEALSGYLLLGSALLQDGASYGEGWNFGPDPSERVTVAEFVGHLTNALGAAAPEVVIRHVGPHEAELLTLDVSKARNRLGWQPVLTVAARAELTADWMIRQLADDLDPSVLGTQIHDFERQWSR